MHKGLKWEREAAVRVMLAGHADELPMSWMQSVRGGVGQGDCGLGLQLLGQALSPEARKTQWGETRS